MNSTHSAGGVKIALDPGLNSLEVTRQEYNLKKSTVKIVKLYNTEQRLSPKEMT